MEQLDLDNIELMKGYVENLASIIIEAHQHLNTVEKEIAIKCLYAMGWTRNDIKQLALGEIIMSIDVENADIEKLQNWKPKLSEEIVEQDIKNLDIRTRIDAATDRLYNLHKLGKLTQIGYDNLDNGICALAVIDNIVILENMYKDE